MDGEQLRRLAEGVSVYGVLRIALGCAAMSMALLLQLTGDVWAAEPATAPPAIPDGTQPQPQPPPQPPPPSDADAGAADSAPPGEAVKPTETPEATPTPEPGTEANAPAEPAPAQEATGSGLFEESLSGDTAGQDTSDGANAPGFDLNGYVRADVFAGKVPDFRQGELKAAYGELALQLKARKERYGDAYAEARLRHGLQGERRELFLELREAYVNAYLGRLDLRLGQQIIVWGRADAVNPTNNLTPSDLRIRSPIEDDRRLGNVGARLFLNLAPVRVEGVWMPIYAPVELPEVVLPEYVTLGEPDFPDPELPNGLFGARVHLELPAVEMSASYVHGYAPLPGLALRDFTAGVNPPVVRIARTAYDQHVAGVDFSTALGELLAIRGEAAYRHPIDYENRVYAPRPDVQYVLGIDRAFGSVSVIAQYMGRYVLDWQREERAANPLDPAALAGFMPPLPPDLTARITQSINGELAVRNQILFSQTREVQHLASLRVEWLTLHDTLSLSALGVVNVSTREWLAFPKVMYEISDAMSTSVGAELYMGPDDTLFGLIDEELSAAYAELRFSF